MVHQISRHLFCSPSGKKLSDCAPHCYSSSCYFSSMYEEKDEFTWDLSGKKKSNFQLSASPVYKEDPLLALTSVTLGSNLLELFIALWENEKKFSIFSLLCVSIQFLMFIFHQQCSLKDSLLLSSSHLQIRPFQIRPSHTTPNKQKYQQVPASLLPLSRCTIFNTDLMKSLFYSSSAKYGL